VLFTKNRIGLRHEVRFNYKNNELTNITTLAKKGGFAIVWNKNNLE
jgi:hypothetical protein